MNQNTKEEIDAILFKLHQCVESNNFYVSKNENRKENIDFIANYNLTHNKIREILLSIKTEDFCYSVNNKKLGYEHEILYIFCPVLELLNVFGESEEIDVYIKFCISQKSNGEFTTVISLHARNKPIDYLFR